MAHPQARPKRAAEDFARTHHNNSHSHTSSSAPFSSSDNHPSKKPRFDVRNPSALAPDALSDDETLEADVIGKRGQQVRRGAVNVDGFDSDSDEDNFDARADAKARAERSVVEKSQAEIDADMFADLEEDDEDGGGGETGEGGGKKEGKKAVRFLDADEIEGQVRSSKSGGHVSADFSLGAQQGKGKSREGEDKEVESSSEDEVDDETRADAEGVDEELGAGSKKLHAPKLDAFNMSTENEEGRFDEQGNYVRKAVDPDSIHDLWMEGLSKKDLRQAKEAHEKREQERRQKDLEDDATSTAEILKRLIPSLETGETVLEALARLGKSKDKKPKWQAKKKSQKQNGSKEDIQMTDTDPTEVKRKETIESITTAADMLLTRGQTEIYEAEKELLIRQYRRETGEDWVEAKASSEGVDVDDGSTKTWEYRWSDARDGGEIHGPYDGATMNSWSQAGYFGEEVEFRQTDTPDSWSRVVDFI